MFWDMEEDYNLIKPVLKELDSEDWEIYRGAYGNVKEVVEELVQEETEEAFEDLCEGISHQMSYYPAINFVMPYLVEHLAKHLDSLELEKQVQYLSRLGLCLATDIAPNRGHRPEPEGSKKDPYFASCEKLKALAKYFLRQHAGELKALSPVDLSMFGIGMLAIFGNRADAYVLFFCSDFISLCCTACKYEDEELILEDKDTLGAIKPAEPVYDRWDGQDFSDTYTWYSGFMKAIGAEREVEHLSYHFGTYTCPECGTKSRVMDLMKEAFACA